MTGPGGPKHATGPAEQYPEGDCIVSHKAQATLVIERDPETGWYVGCIAELPGCYSQAPDVEQLRRNMQEALECYLAVYEGEGPWPEFIGTEPIEVPQ